MMALVHVQTLENRIKDRLVYIDRYHDVMSIVNVRLDNHRKHYLNQIKLTNSQVEEDILVLLSSLELNKYN